MSESFRPGAALLQLLVAQRAAQLCRSLNFGHLPTPGAPLCPLGSPLPPDRGRSPAPSTEKHPALISLQVPSACCHNSPVPTRLWRYPIAACPGTNHLSGPPAANQGSANAAGLCFGFPPPLIVRASQARLVPSPAPITPQRDKDGTRILNAATAVYQRDLESFERKSMMNSPTITGTECRVTTYPSPYIQIY